MPKTKCMLRNWCHKRLVLHVCDKYSWEIALNPETHINNWYHSRFDLISVVSLLVMIMSKYYEGKLRPKKKMCVSGNHF